MKKNKFISIIIFLILSLSLVVCFCAGCDFIQYVDTSKNQVISDEVKLLQKDYVDNLYNVTSEIKYRENEQKIYEYALQDAINELYECCSEAELKQVYDKHLVTIGKIKTDKEYSDEEEANAISAYRVAILGQAEDSYDKQKYSETQITYLDGVFAAFSGELSDTNIREEMNELLQKFYSDVHKEDEILSLINYADISVYEDSQKGILIATLNKCIEEIRSCINEEDIDDIKGIYVFEVFKRDTVKKLNDYIDLQLYREEQAAEIKSILKEYLELAEEAETNIEEDNIFREYQMTVYDIPTDEMLYSEELKNLKEELNSSLVNSYKLSFYRESEGVIVQEILKSFHDLLGSIKNKEEVLSHYILVKSKLDSVKTSEEIAVDDRANLISELYSKLLNYINNYIDEMYHDEYLAQSELVYSAMCDRVSLGSIRQVYREFALEIGMVVEILKEELEEYNDTVFYREDEQKQVNAIKDEYLLKFVDDLSTDEAKALFQEAKDAINEIKTNDDLWDDSLTQFRTDLKLLYGDTILGEPRSLTEANDYYELADIIDYYAFYQLSGTEFVCDTFRVKLNFSHNDAWTELVNVYWYCELIRTAVGITNYFENNSDYLVFQLIPYNFASVSNERPALHRLKSAVEFDSDKSQMTDRPSDFDDFAYYKYERTISVWNSQQLWYALEHEYVPICAPDSPAERLMNRAKEILREIIMEGMSDEEKIFQIYTWFGKNSQYDWKYGSFLNSSNSSMFPDENISKLCSFHAEGALFDQLGVCYSYAKANLILLRIEGIEAYYVFGRSNLSNIAYSEPGGAGHSYNYIFLNNNWFIGDALRSFYQSRNYGDGISYLFLLLPAKDIYKSFTDRDSRVNSNLWPLIETGSIDNRDIYKSLIVNGNKIFITKDILDNINLFDNVDQESFSIICDPDSFNTVFNLLKEKYEIYQIRYVDTYIELFCERH